MDNLAVRENDILSSLESLKDDIEAIQQNRSNFVIKNFVVGSHMTPGRQRMQCVQELQIKMFNIRDMQLDAEKINIEIEKLVKGGERYGDYDERLRLIDLEKKKLQLSQIELSRLSQVREAECLYSILQSLPKYTREQYEEEEQLYWTMRLNEQIELSNDRGNIQALKQINRGILTKPLTQKAMVEGTKIANAILEDKPEETLLAPEWGGSGKKKAKK
jgi:hypothetical protein